jgi:ubiquinone/menaquinone biosynthesis C-methylase UbiE
MTAHEHEKQFHGSPEKLRTPERMALLQLDRTLPPVFDGIEIATALDVGTGSGIFAERFAARGIAVTCLDLNPDMLEVARQYVPNATFVEAGFDAMPFEDKSFDLTFFGHALHESDDLNVTLAEAARVTKVRVASLEWPHREEEHGPPLWHRLTADQVRNAARTAGFTGVRVHEFDHAVLYILDSTPIA